MVCMLSSLLPYWISPYPHITERILFRTSLDCPLDVHHQLLVDPLVTLLVKGVITNPLGESAIDISEEENWIIDHK